MAITINPINKIMKVTIEEGEEKVVLKFKQLDYRTKSHITSLVTGVKQGQLSHDSMLQVFYNIKYALKDIEGVTNEDGSEYKLRFIDETELEDSCVEELLACPFNDKLQYTAHALANSALPNEVTHPLTGKALEGVSVIIEQGGVRKK